MMMMRAILLWLALCSIALGQPVAKITGPSKTPTGEMVVLSSVGSVGDNLAWIKPDLQTLQVGCSVLDTQVVFATSKPGRYEFVLIVADKEARIDYAKHVVEVGAPTTPPPPTTPPTNPPNPPTDGKWDSMKTVSKSGADVAKDPPTRSKLKASVASTVLVLADTLPSLDDAMKLYSKDVEDVLMFRSGESKQTDWVTWRKGIKAELDRQGIVDTRDYIEAVRAIGSGL